MFRLAFLAVLVTLLPSSATAAPGARPGYDASAKISPNGRWIAFERYFASGNRYVAASHSLRIVDAEGRAERELVPESREGVDAKWTPSNLLEVTQGSDTFLIDPEDGSRVGAAIRASAFSPDGRWIAYVKDQELWVASPDGSNARRVAVGTTWIGVGAFSPDSTRLTYSAHTAAGADVSGIVALDGTGDVRLREAPVAAPGIWAPDSNSVVFMAQNDRPHYRPPKIYVATADGTSVRRLVQGFASGPDWSPTGDWIAYETQVTTRRQDRYYLMLAHPDGSGAHRVMRTGSGTWLSDGRRVLSVGNGGCRRAGILEIDVFLRTVKRLTNRCRIDGTPQADRLRGTALRDLIYGLAGNDTIAGRGGEDDLHGGPGNDVLLARDGGRDRVDCGRGRDSVVADRDDRVARDCERVIRR